jgi:hypothetical protein
MKSVSCFFLPNKWQVADFVATEAQYVRSNAKVNAKLLSPGAGFTEACNYLRQKAYSDLASLSIHHIIKVISEIASNWCNPNYPLRRRADEILPVTTGLSREMISRLIEVFFAKYELKTLYDYIEKEIGNVDYLDDNQTNLYNRNVTRVFGPRLTVNLLGGHNPIIASHTIIINLLCKSAAIYKLSSREPIFPTLFAKSIREIDPIMGNSLAILWWPHYSELFDHIIEYYADIITLSGDDKTASALVQKVPEEKKLLINGSQTSVGLITKKKCLKDELSEAAKQTAIAISWVDQRSCFSPHIIYVEKDMNTTALDFAYELDRQMSEVENILPSGEPDNFAIIAKRRFIQQFQFKQYNSSTVKIISTNSPWTVIYDRDCSIGFGPSYRVIRVCPIDNASEVCEHIASSKIKVTSIGIWGTAETFHQVATKMSSTTVTRICPIGKLASPHLLAERNGGIHLSKLIKTVHIESHE